jgi:hypothetical protein
MMESGLGGEKLHLGDSNWAVYHGAKEIAHGMGGAFTVPNSSFLERELCGYRELLLQALGFLSRKVLNYETYALGCGIRATSDT